MEAVRGAGGRYGIVKGYGGHGIGTAMHMDPYVPNYGGPGHGPRLRAGMALAMEPMVTLGRPTRDLLDDGWTVVTADGPWACALGAHRGRHRRRARGSSPTSTAAPPGSPPWRPSPAAPASASRALTASVPTTAPTMIT